MVAELSEFSWRKVRHCIAVGAGQWLATHLEVSRYVKSRIVPFTCSFALTCLPLPQLFGASAVTKDYVLGVTDYSNATWTQNFIASVSGAVASITVAAPLDVIKTRIQNANFEHKVSGFTVMKDLLKHEGPLALFKGLTPKVGRNRQSPYLRFR